MYEEISEKALDAYKASPLLTGLLLLNLALLLGFGWFLKGKNEQHEALVTRMLDEEKQFRAELLQVAISCRPSSGKPGYIPLSGN